jgi:heme/copper-type cytochrome/quinol oxidase subunit 2
MGISAKRTKGMIPSRKQGSLRTWLLLAVATLGTLPLLPGLVSACSVCTAGREEENQLAFLLSTIFMSLLPLIVIGTIVFALWRRIRKLEEEESARAAGLPAGELGYRTGSGLG